MGFKIVVKAAAVIVAVVIILALTCPDEDSFDRWAKKALADESGSGLDKAKGKVLATQANWTADYEDSVLWATVEAYQGGTRHRYLGVVGMWFDLGEI